MYTHRNYPSGRKNRISSQVIPSSLLVYRFHRCRSEFHYAAAAYVVHTLRRIRALCDAASAAAMVRPRRLWNGANTHGDGWHKSPAGLHIREKTHRTSVSRISIQSFLKRFI